MRKHQELAEAVHAAGGIVQSQGNDGMSGRLPAGFTFFASWGGSWDHVSVSKPSRDPNWQEMCAIKDLFFYDEEIVVQYHPAKSEYKNVHKHCLHLWRPQDQLIPKPPRIYV